MDFSRSRSSNIQDNSDTRVFAKENRKPPSAGQVAGTTSCEQTQIESPEKLKHNGYNQLKEGETEQERENFQVTDSDENGIQN